MMAIRLGIRRRTIAMIGQLCLGLIFGALAAGSSQAEERLATSPDGTWAGVEESLVPSAPSYLTKARYSRLNMAALEQVLSQAPLEFSEAAEASSAVISIPMPDGTFASFAVEESPILGPDLALKFPDIKTYVGRALDEPGMTGRFDRTALGFHGIVFSTRGTAYVDPIESEAADVYVAYWKADARPGDGDRFRCYLEHEGPVTVVPAAAPSGTQLRTYRLAVTATGEYTTDAGGVAQAQARIATTINRVTGIYERELAIRLNLVATNIYDDPDTDPFASPTNVNGTLLSQNNTDLNDNIGAANYDVGHLVSQGDGGGLAALACVCSGTKGRGATSLDNTTGDVFAVDYVAHELGHQFGGNHSFNGTTRSCGGNNRNGGTAYEPGSGTTIMAYAGICGAENVQSNSDDYFHGISFDEITNFRDGGGAACGTSAATGNTPPIVGAGGDHTIPRETPFTLTASGSDADGDALTYCWEQFDLGAASPPYNTVDGPIFRSRPALASASRTFPRFSDLLSGAATPWERLAAVDRTLTFRVTARDNRAAGGGVNNDSMQVNVAGAPFDITQPDGGDDLECGLPNTILWSVGGGAVAPTVDITISTNGGASFSVLAAGTANDGSESVTAPKTLTSDARVKIDAVGNIFFTLSDGAVTIQDTTDPDLMCPADATVECTGSCGIQASDPQLATFAATVTDACDEMPTLVDDRPGFFPLGATPVQFTSQDASGNATSCTATVTAVDTVPPDVTLIEPADRRLLIPSTLPFSILYASSDVCGVTAEKIKLAGCTIYDGWTYGDQDGLLSDESLLVTRAELCRVSALCGFGGLNQPELRVEVTDCGGNVSFDAHTFSGSARMFPGICGP